MKLNQLLRPLTRRTKRQLLTSASRAVNGGIAFEPLENRQMLSLTVNLEVANTNAKTASVSKVGDVVNLNVMVTVSGSTSGANDGFQSLCGSFLSTLTDGNYSVGGNISQAIPTGPNDEYQANGAQEATSQDLNGDGYLDAGSNNNSDIAGFFNARAGGITQDGTVSGNSQTFDIGTLKYTVANLNYGQATDINFRIRNGIPAGAFDAVWLEDGNGENDQSGSVVIGSPVVVTDSSLSPPPDGSISGTVTANESGVTVPLSGVTVFLDENGKTTPQSGDPQAVTGANGTYTISGLHASTYDLLQVVPSQYTQTSPSSTPTAITLATSQNLSGQNFTDTGTASISGTVSQVVNNTTSAFSGVKVYADLGNTGSYSSSDPSATTNASGNYTLSGLISGTYDIREVVPAGFAQTTPGSSPTVVTLSAGQAETGTSFTDTSTTVSPGSISGTVDKVVNGVTSAYSGVTLFLDTNGNGKLDSGEPLVTTDSNGNFDFTGLQPNTYLLRQSLPAGAKQTSPAATPTLITITSGENVSGQDFIDAATAAQTGSISGSVTKIVSGVSSAFAVVTVYLDTNNNGSLDSGEPSTTTNASGAYSFTGLAAGPYNIREVVPSGYSQTLPGSSPTSVTLSAGQNATGENFTDTAVAVVNNASISGTVFKVVSGVTSADPGVTVYLDTNDNGSLDSGEPSTTTNASGAYSFTGLAAGPYNIREVVPTGYTQTSPGSTPTSVTLSAGQSATGENFTDTAATVASNASISGTVYKIVSGVTSVDAGVVVYLDTNNNGSLDSGETSITTSSLGTYTFSNLAAGTYHLREVIPTGYTQTSPVSSPTNITLTSGQAATGQNFTDTAITTTYIPGSIAGEVYVDTNGNGKLDSGEAGLSGVEMYIDLNKDNTIDSGDPTTTTSATGTYSFTGLAPGTYRVREVVPSGYKLTDPNAAVGYFDIIVQSNWQIHGENWGNVPTVTTGTASISGEVFSDANGNGKIDTGEDGIPNVTVYLDLNKNGKFDSGEPTTTTNSTGVYSFSGLAAGTYVVREVVPSGDKVTVPSSASISVSLTNGFAEAGVDFGLTGPVTLSGNVFNDINGDGVQEAGEGGLAGWVVYCDLNNDGKFEANENNKTTDANGNFEFVSLKAGNYILRIYPKAGYTQTLPNGGFYSVTISPAIPNFFSFGEHA